MGRQSKLGKRELEILEQRSMALHNSRNAILKAQQEVKQKGREAGAQDKAREIARSLLGVLDAETISRTIGLSVAEVERLS